MILRTKTFLWLKDVKKYLEELQNNGELLVSPLSRPPWIDYSIIAMMYDPRKRVNLIAMGSECLEHMLGLARKYSNIGDCDRSMILHSNTLLTITGLLELHRSIFEEGAIAATEDFLESRQKCKELLLLLANTAQQAMEGEGQRIRDFITVFLSRST